MGYLTENDQAGAHARSWYAETAGPLPDHPPLAGDVSADVCIVGGGYAGLSAALHLAEAGLSVRLLEANRVGWGASGRNGGQLGLGPRAEMDDYVRAIGPADARKVWEIAVAANRLVRGLVAKHDIDCDLRDGRIIAAWRRSDARALADWPEAAARHYGYERMRPLSRVELAEAIGSERYHGGVLIPDEGHLHPLKLAIGMGSAATAAGAVLHERSLVTAVAPGQVRTREGSVRAPHILLACNGYIDGLAPEVQRRSMPINNFIAATAPLPAETIDRINRSGACVCDTKFVVNYFRVTPCGRLLWGGGESYGRRFPRDIEGLVRRAMREIYPDLAAVPFTHAWGGTLAITLTRMPAFQDLGGGVLAISGWSGSGVHMATMGGKIAAEALLGRAERWDLLSRLPTPAFPGGDWFRAPLMAAAMTWYALRDRL
ncbi:MAG: NAD(P)/FAD-dependent oxidoreductase [Pikeienuella sp.]